MTTHTNRVEIDQKQIQRGAARHLASAAAKSYPPFGYKQLHALGREDFVRMHTLGEVPHFAAMSAILPLTFSEFFVASSDYPIVFTRTHAHGAFMPVVVVGLEKDASLFAHHDEKVWRWDANSYLPAYVRRHPFCMSTVNGQSSEDDELLVCVDQDYVCAEAASQYVQLFHDESPTKRWEMIEAFLQGYQADIATTADFTKALSDFGLFKALSTNLIPSNVYSSIGVDAMFGFDEDKLNTLSDSVLADLHRRGYLARIYAQLNSLQNFQKLVRRFEQQTFSASAKQAGFNA